MKTRIAVGRPAAFTLIELLVVIAIIGVLIALLLPAVQACRAAARRTQCINNEMQMALAMQNYDSAFEVLPPGVVNGVGAGPIDDRERGYRYSWLVQILPFMDQKNIYNHLNFAVGAYDGANSTARSIKIASFLCPSDGMAGEPAASGAAQSSYFGVHHDAEVPIDDTNNGLLYLNSHVRIEDIEDGASNTLLFGEAKIEKGLMGWASGNRSTLRNVGTTINGVPPGPTAVNPAPVGGFSSFHPGGADFGMADGSVKFLKNTTGAAILRTLANRADGEMVSQGAY